MSPHQLNNMKKRKQLVVWYTMLVLTFALFTSVIVPTANATVISSSSDVLFTVSHNNSFDFVVNNGGDNTFVVSIPQYESLLISDNSKPVVVYNDNISYTASGWDASYANGNLTINSKLYYGVYNYIVVNYASHNDNVSVGYYGNIGDDITKANVFNNYSFDWYWYQSSIQATPNSSVLNSMITKNKKILLRVWFWGNPSIYGKNWTDLANDDELIGIAITDALDQISYAGISNVSAIVISEEEPGVGYNWGTTNETDYVYSHNQIYSAIKSQYPNVPVLAGVHLFHISASNLSNLSRDGVVDDWYNPLTGTQNMSEWFDLMKAEQDIHPDTYALIWAGSGWRSMELLTPQYTIDAFELGVSKDVNNIGFFGYDYNANDATIYIDTYNELYPVYNRSELYKDSMLYLLSNVMYKTFDTVVDNTRNVLSLLLLPTASATVFDNTTSDGWTTTNVNLNGSRFTDSGQLAIHLRNDSALNMTNLTAYWSFDETQNTTIHNVNNETGLSNSTNQGTWFGNTTLNYSSGYIGNAGSFDGVDDYVDVGKDQSLSVGTIYSNYTISAWIKTTTVFVEGYIVTDISSTNLQPIRLEVVGNVAATELYDGVSNPAAIGIIPVNDGNWHMITGVVNRTKDLKIYTDGVLEATVPDTTVGDITSDMGVEIGRRSNQVGVGFNFNGLIDEVHFYNRYLNASEISVLYNTSMRPNGNVTIWKQTSVLGGAINRTRLIVNNTQVHNNTVDLYTKPNSSAVWNLTATNLSNNTWYNIDAGNQSTSQDFLVAMSGNGSDTPFFTSLEWDEVFIPVPTPSISCTNAYRDINSAFQLIGILLILFAAMMIIIGIQNYNNPSYLIMGATSGVIGAVMLAVGVFVVITVGTGAGCV